MTHRITAAAVVAATGLGAVASAQPMFAVAGFGSVGSQGLYRVDTATGAAALVGDTGVGDFIGLAWDGTNLLGLTTSNGVYTINTATGEAFFAGADFGVSPEGDLAFRDGGLVASTTGALLDVSAGSVAAFATLSSPLDLSGLTDLDGTDWLGFATGYGASDALYRIDAGGTATLLFEAATGSTGVGALERDDAGTVYLSDGATLYTVDLGGNAVSTVGAFGVSGVSGLAVIPAPGAVLAFGVLGLAGARRRR